MIDFGDTPTLMLESFRQMSEAEQKDMAMLAANARFILRMIESVDSDTVRIIRQALTRGIPSLGGEPL